MKKIVISITVLIYFVIVIQPVAVLAYSYGDPGEEKIAESYKELKQYIEDDQWDQAEQLIQSYDKEFNLYFKKAYPLIKKALEEKDEELLLQSYQVALRLNIERRLHFAQDQFDDYGQAKLLLAKARGTFNVLEPTFKEKQGEEATQKVYDAFDKSLESLGNPGLFGIGSKSSDKDTFVQQVEYINQQIKETYKLPKMVEEDAHLTEENLDIFGNEKGGTNPIWKWISIGLVGFFILLIMMNKWKQRKSE